MTNLSMSTFRRRVMVCVGLAIVGSAGYWWLVGRFGHDPSLVGRWTKRMSSGTWYLDLEPNGRAEVNKSTTNDKGKLQEIARGSWKSTGDLLVTTLTFKDEASDVTYQVNPARTVLWADKGPEWRRSESK